jgi:NADH-quinone oxidoreductase subunit E
VSPLVPKVPEPEWEGRVPEEIQGDLLEDVSLAAEPAVEEERRLERDPAPVPEPSEVEVPRALAQEIRRAMKRYPEKRSAAIPALWAVQRRYGWCSPEGIRQAAAVMEVTPGYLESVASFYDLFHLEPRGEHQVLVCTNISCWLKGSDELLEAFKQAADGPADGTMPGTPGAEGEEVPVDDVYIRGFECLGACDIAPMASIDERYYGPLENGDAAEAIEQLRGKREVLPEKRLEDREVAGGPKVPADERITRHPINKVKQKRRAPAKPKGKG